MISDYSEFRKSISKTPLAEGQIDEQDEWVLRLAGEYLESTAPQRHEIREMFADEDAQWYLLLIVDRLCERRWTEDRDWLGSGLAVLSIQNRRFDPRDFITRAENLYQRAKKEGLDPSARFREIARISRDEKDYFQQSTAELLLWIAKKCEQLTLDS